MNGAPALPEALRASSALGLDLSSHRSRTLGDFPLGDADLVVGFETRHLTRAVVDGGGRPNRSFLLEEIVEALEGSELPETERDVQRARVAVALARVRRRASGSTAMPIRDPFGRSRAECEQTAARVHDLAVRLAAVLFGSTRD